MREGADDPSARDHAACSGVRRAALLGLTVVLSMACSGPVTASRQPPATTFELHRSVVQEALRDEQRCLGSPTGQCSETTDRLERLLDEAITATAGLETHSTIPARTIVDVRTKASKVTMDIAAMHTCDRDRTLSPCASQLPAIDDQLGELDRALDDWPID